MSLLATFGFILICCHALAIETNGHPTRGDVYATKVEDFLENLKAMIRSGNESLGIPPLDPFTAEKLSLPINEKDLIELDLVLTKVDVRGLSEYNVNKGELKIAGLKLLADLTWPLVYATTNYSMNGILGGEMPIFGKGDIKAGAKGFNVYCEISFKLKGLKYLEVKDVILKIALNELDFKATGLFDDEELSELMSAMVSEMVPKLIKENHDDIVNIVKPEIKNIANGFLDGKTLSDLIKMFG